MFIQVLVENTSSHQDLASEHGLSLYIETKKHKLLFDTGSSGLFLKNAEKLGVKLEEVDALFISHGHYDHGGGLKDFLSINSKAVIYINQHTFGDYYSKNTQGQFKYIGLDKDIKDNDRYFLVEGDLVIDEELRIISDIEKNRLNPPDNDRMFTKVGETYVRDDFSHEQSLLIEEEGKRVLVTGCSHSGVVNILEGLYKKEGSLPDYLIGGFHLMAINHSLEEVNEVISGIGTFLMSSDIQCYTCHCTEEYGYKRLKNYMGERINYLSTGDVLKL